MRPWSGASGSPFGRRDPRDDGLQDSGDAGALLGRHEDDLLARDGQHVLQLLDDHVGLGRGQVDLVDDRHDDQALREGQVDVGERLGLDALGGVDDEDGALAGLQAAADLVGEVDVAGRVDEVEAVASGRRVAVYSRRTARALMVMPFSRSRSIESSTWLVIWRASMVCVSSRMRSASVDLPWSTWAMMVKLRRRAWGMVTGAAV